MAAKTIAYRIDILNVMRGVNITAPSAVYLAAFSVLSSDGSSGGTEVVAATRQPITWSTGGSSGQSGNTTEILFPVASTSWGTVTGVGVWTSSGAAGALPYSHVLTTSVTINANDQLKFSSGALTLQEI